MKSLTKRKLFFFINRFRIVFLMIKNCKEARRL